MRIVMLKLSIGQYTAGDPRMLPGHNSSLGAGHVAVVNVPDDVTLAQLIKLANQTACAPQRYIIDYAELRPGALLKGRQLPLVEAAAIVDPPVIPDTLRQQANSGRFPASKPYRGAPWAVHEDDLRLWQIHFRQGRGRPAKTTGAA